MKRNRNLILALVAAAVALTLVALAAPSPAAVVINGDTSISITLSFSAAHAARIRDAFILGEADRYLAFRTQGDGSVLPDNNTQKRAYIDSRIKGNLMAFTRQYEDRVAKAAAEAALTDITVGD